VTIDELNEALDWNIPKKDYETVSGLILSVLGRIPRPGEQVFVDGYELSVVDADERRILKVKVRAQPRAAEPPKRASGT
jgi:CBS domain containing-hemolysin-like protein